MIQIKLKTEEAEYLQEQVNYHIEMCYESLEEENEFEPYDLFCGCQTCVTREYIMKTCDVLKELGKADIYVED